MLFITSKVSMSSGKLSGNKEVYLVSKTFINMVTLEVS